MRLIDGDYLYNKLVANKCPYDLVLQMVKDEPTVCDIEQIRAEIKKEYEDNVGCGDNDLYTLGLKKALEIIDIYREE